MGNKGHAYSNLMTIIQAQPIFRRVGLFILLTLEFVSTLSGSIHASEKPQRSTEIIVPFIEYEWWLIRWSSNQPECRILTDHEGLPNGDDVYIYCGEDVNYTSINTRILLYITRIWYQIV